MGPMQLLQRAYNICQIWSDISTEKHHRRSRSTQWMDGWRWNVLSILKLKQANVVVQNRVQDCTNELGICEEIAKTKNYSLTKAPEITESPHLSDLSEKR